MKQLLTILLITISTACIAQNKKDNAIILLAKDVTEEKINKALITSGYPIEKSGKTYILTGEASKLWSNVKIAVSFIDSSYVVQGWQNPHATIGGSQTSNMPIINTFTMKKYWNELITVAKKISEEISYTKL